jgi:hypothetical protein
MLKPNARQGGGTPDGAIDYGVHFIDGQPLDGLRTASRYTCQYMHVCTFFKKKEAKEREHLAVGVQEDVEHVEV